VDRLSDAAGRIGEILVSNEQSVCIAEGSCGGLMAASLVAVPGASRFFVAGAVLYTRPAFTEILGDEREALRGLRGATEPFSLTIAQIARRKFGSTWAIGESGATGPSGNRYGDAAGHAALAIAGPVEKTLLLETGIEDRRENMRRFALAALNLFEQALAEAASGPA